MPIRQNYIDQFKVYCKLAGYKPEENENNMQFLFHCIALTLSNYGYVVSQLVLDSNAPLTTNFCHEFRKNDLPTIYGIRKEYKDHEYKECSWKIGNSNKLHNNTSMICYLMRKVLCK